MAKNKTYFTLTGTQFYHGKDFLEKDMIVKLVKDSLRHADRSSLHT